ncbi:MAG: hypothetical protein O7B99_10375 [Planctomycetota bacterium]|nr:hypothetical protein [Planctomycetota bacterium]
MSIGLRRLFLVSCLGLGVLQAPDAARATLAGLRGPYPEPAGGARARTTGETVRAEGVFTTPTRKRWNHESGPTGM